MPDQLTSTGLEIDDYETRFANIVADLRSTISTVLDVSTDQPTGQFVQIQTEQIQAIAELLQELHSALDPDQATGQSLDAVCSITGTYRRAATFGSVAVTLNITGAVTVPAGSIAAVSGDPDNQWILDADVTGPGAAVPGTMTAATAGQLTAPAGTLTVIVTPVAGWNSITNPLDAVPGAARETDTALRLRREVEVTTGGSTSVDAIQAACSQLTGMIQCICYENPYWYAAVPVTDATSMPPHSVHLVYWDGGGGAVTAAVLAEEIFEEKAGGIQAYGATTETHTDTQGNDHVIGFTLATQIAVTIVININSDGTVAAGTLQTNVATAIAAYDESDLGIGDDVYISQISAVAVAVTGVLNVVSMTLNGFGVDLAIDPEEIATIAFGDITVNIV
jgi:uncharacterized phage protein gp47/JayE